MKRRCAITFCLLLLGCTARGYVLENIVWGHSFPAIYVSLSASQAKLGSRLPRFPLQDGSGSFDQVFFSAVASWNSYLLNLRIQPIEASIASGVDSNPNLNETGFAATAAGDSLGGTTLAVTLIYYYPGNPNTFAPTDIVFNSSGLSWNSYRGPLSPGAMDLRRVALHELGHFIGLDHPDQNGQTVNAIMNSIVGDTDQLTADDIAGGRSLYGPTKGDFVGNGRSSILLRNQQTGEVRIWVMNGNSIVNDVSIGTVCLDWRIAGIADFDGDGLSDILWVNRNFQQIAIWTATRANPFQFVSHEFSAALSSWDLLGAADLDGKGYADILWRNHFTGEVATWRSVSPFNFVEAHVATAGPEWNFAGVASLDGSRTPELIWRSQYSGEVRGWKLDGTASMTVTQNTAIGTATLDWQIAGFGDFNGDGQQDILWRNTNSGAVAVWIMNGFTIATQWFPGSATSDWNVAGTGHFGADPYTDIIWSNAGSGQQVLWTTNGLTLYSDYPFAVEDPSWQVPRVQATGFDP